MEQVDAHSPKVAQAVYCCTTPQQDTRVIESVFRQAFGEPVAWPMQDEHAGLAPEYTSRLQVLLGQAASMGVPEMSMGVHDSDEEEDGMEFAVIAHSYKQWLAQRMGAPALENQEGNMQPAPICDSDGSDSAEVITAENVGTNDQHACHMDGGMCMMRDPIRSGKTNTKQTKSKPGRKVKKHIVKRPHKQVPEYFADKPATHTPTCGTAGEPKDSQLGNEEATIPARQPVLKVLPVMPSGQPWAAITLYKSEKPRTRVVLSPDQKEWALAHVKLFLNVHGFPPDKKWYNLVLWRVGVSERVWDTMTNPEGLRSHCRKFI